MASTLNIRIDDELKAKASEVIGYYGLDISSAVRAFLTQVANTGTIPLSFSGPVPNDETVQAMADLEAIRADPNHSSFATADELFDELGI